MRQILIIFYLIPIISMGICLLFKRKLIDDIEENNGLSSPEKYFLKTTIDDWTLALIPILNYFFFIIAIALLFILYYDIRAYIGIRFWIIRSDINLKRLDWAYILYKKWIENRGSIRVERRRKWFLDKLEPYFGNMYFWSTIDPVFGKAYLLFCKEGPFDMDDPRYIKMSEEIEKKHAGS